MFTSFILLKFLWSYMLNIIIVSEKRLTLHFTACSLIMTVAYFNFDVHWPNQRQYHLIIPAQHKSYYQSNFFCTQFVKHWKRRDKNVSSSSSPENVPHITQRSEESLIIEPVASKGLLSPSGETVRAKLIILCRLYSQNKRRSLNRTLLREVSEHSLFLCASKDSKK